MGTALEEMGEREGSRKLYELALEFDPELGEAHATLAHWHRRDGGDLEKALAHFEAVTRRKGSALQMSAIRGWTAEVLFRLNRVDAAYAQIRDLLNVADRHAWVWPWTSKLVAIFSRQFQAASQQAIDYWRRYLSECSDDHHVRMEILNCKLRLRFATKSTKVTFEAFKSEALSLMDKSDSDDAFLWDRIGHWAQCDEDWIEAEKAYKRAYNIEPARFGYCYGTALVFLARHEEALPILVEQAEEHQPDAMSWFQVGNARGGLSYKPDRPGAIAAYRKAIELDPEYALAWFNLGGEYWNQGDVENARETWRTAVEQFPEHELANRIIQKRWLDS